MQAGRSRQGTRRASVPGQPHRRRSEGRVRVQALSRERVGTPRPCSRWLPRARPEPLQARPACRYVALPHRRLQARRPDLPLRPRRRLQGSPAYHVVPPCVRQGSVALEVLRQAPPALQPASPSQGRPHRVGAHRRGREDRRRGLSSAAEPHLHHVVGWLQGRQHRRLVSPLRSPRPLLA